MAILKTTQHIFNHPWEEELVELPSSSYLPKVNKLKIDSNVILSDIKLWEQIYYKKGNIGIYAAWDPYIEYYIIVHNLFINTTVGVEEFFGEDASTKTWERAREYGINLSPS